MPARLKRRPVQLGPWKGVRDIGDAGAQDPAFAQDAINCLFPDTLRGGNAVVRPGFARVNTSQSTATSGGTHEFLAIHGIEGSDGTVYLFAVQGGKVSRQSSATALTDVTPVGPTLADHVRFYPATYNNEVIFSDGTNRPWRATSLGATPITGTNIQYETAATAWAARGQPTIYGGKLFFIVKSVGSTNYQSRIAWSEELTAATGYAQDGFDNVWDVVPSSTDRIQHLIGTNAALYYFRSYSIGAIYGAVNADFRTAATNDSVSQEIGILSTCAPIAAKGYIWFLDADGLPHRFKIGSTEIEPLWQQLRRRIVKIKNTALDANGYLVDFPQIVYCQDLNKVVMLFLRDSSATGDAAKSLYVFDADTGSYEGRWIVRYTARDFTDPPAAANYIDSIASVPIPTSASSYTGAYSLVTGGAESGGTFGYLTRQSLHRQQIFSDESVSTIQVLVTMLEPDAIDVEYHVDEVAMEAVPDSTSMSLDIYTPYGSTLAQSATGLTGSDLIQSSHDHGVYRWGVSSTGRWLRFVFHWTIASGTTQYALERARLNVIAFPTGGTTK